MREDTNDRLRLRIVREPVLFKHRTLQEGEQIIHAHIPHTFLQYFQRNAEHHIVLHRLVLQNRIRFQLLAYQFLQLIPFPNSAFPALHNQREAVLRSHQILPKRAAERRLHRMLLRVDKTLQQRRNRHIHIAIQHVLSTARSLSSLLPQMHPRVSLRHSNNALDVPNSDGNAASPHAFASNLRVASRESAPPIATYSRSCPDRRCR